MTSIPLTSLNNPFPKDSQGLPFVHGSLHFSLAGLRYRCLPVGENFFALWQPEKGGCLSLHHRSEPGKCLWSSVAYRAFVSGALGEPTVVESRGSFAIQDKVLLVLKHQTVESIRLVRPDVPLHDEGGDWEELDENSGPAENEASQHIEGVADSGEGSKNTRTLDGAAAAEVAGFLPGGAIHSSVIISGFLCSDYTTARVRIRRPIRRGPSVDGLTARQRRGLGALRPRVILSRLRRMRESTRPREGPACQLSVGYTLTFVERGQHSLGFALKFDKPTYTLDDVSDDEEGSTEAGEISVDGSQKLPVHPPAPSEEARGAQPQGDYQDQVSTVLQAPHASSTVGSHGEASDYTSGAQLEANSGWYCIDDCGDETLAQYGGPGTTEDSPLLAPLELSDDFSRDNAEAELDGGDRETAQLSAPQGQEIGRLMGTGDGEFFTPEFRHALEANENIFSPEFRRILDPKLRLRDGNVAASIVPQPPGVSSRRLQPRSRWWWQSPLPAGTISEPTSPTPTVQQMPQPRKGLLGRLSRWRRLAMEADQRALRLVLRQWSRMGRVALLNRCQLTYASQASERFFGFGEQFSFFDLKGRRVPVLVQEQGIGRGDPPVTWVANLASYRGGGAWHTTYAPVPQYITSEMRCFYLDNYEFSLFDLRRRDRVQVQVHAGQMEGHIIHGKSPPDLIRHYTEGVGRMHALPRWITRGAIVGMQGGTEKVRGILQRLSQARTPVAAFWLQDWCGQRVTSFGRQLWWNWELDRDHYPGWEALVAEMASKGIRVMAYCNPYLAEVDEKPNSRRNLFKEAVDNNYIIKDIKGQPYMIENTSFHAAMVDLSNPATCAWMKNVIREMVQLGISGWMADFGEALPFDANLHSGESPSTAHNRYPEMWAELNRQIVAELEDEARQARCRLKNMQTRSQPTALSALPPGVAAPALMAEPGREAGKAMHDDFLKPLRPPEAMAVSLEASCQSTSLDECHLAQDAGYGDQEASEGNVLGSGQPARQSHAAASDVEARPVACAEVDRAEPGLEAKAVDEEVEEDEERLVFFGRAGFRNSPGLMALFWLGDQMVSWQRHDGIKSAVTGLLSSGLSGFAFNHSDIGGYTTIAHRWINYTRSEELLLRWMEVNCMTTIFRTHEGNMPSANVQFYSSDAAFAHFDRFARVYAAWAFYRFQLVQEAASTGMPVVRHLFLHYPKDRQVLKLVYQQFLVGTEILVAPVLDPGHVGVLVYFPPGEKWEHLWTGQVYEYLPRVRGTKTRVPAPLGQPAIFFRQGSPVGVQMKANLRAQGLLP